MIGESLWIERMPLEAFYKLILSLKELKKMNCKLLQGETDGLMLMQVAALTELACNSELCYTIDYQ